MRTLIGEEREARLEGRPHQNFPLLSEQVGQSMRWRALMASSFLMFYKTHAARHFACSSHNDIVPADLHLRRYAKIDLLDQFWSLRASHSG